MSVLCLGEAIVDLVCEEPVTDLSEAPSLVPHCGGAVANAAVVAARCGADVTLAGGVGDDPWGRWLERRLRDEGVDLRWLSRVPGLATPLACVAVDHAGEPHFLVYGEGIAAAMSSLAGRLEEAIDSSDALLLGSNTLVGSVERELTLRARELALGAGKPVMLDVNLRLHRWEEQALAPRLVRELCAGALLVKVNGDESRLLTGEVDPAAAAEALVALGPALVVVTLGARGALARGEERADVAGVPASVVDTTGAGDVVTGVLVAALAAGGFEPAAAVEALPAAVAAAARSTEGWGAVDALPPAPLRA